MATLQESMKLLKELLQEKNVDHALCSVGESTVQELTYEHGECSLLRTLYDQNMGITIIKGQKQGTTLTTGIDETSLRNAIDTALTSAEASDADEDYALAETQEPLTLTTGVLTPDMEKLLERVKELGDEITKEFPKVQLMQIMATHVYSHRLTHNTHGGDGDFQNGYYTLDLEFAGHEGDTTASLNGHSISFLSLDTPLIELDGVRATLKSSEDELNLTRFEGKFTGKVIFTPACARQILGYTVNSLASNRALLSKTGPWIDKLDKKVASDSLTLKLVPTDERILDKSFITQDGYWAKDYVMIEKGILKQFDCNLYTAKKIGASCAPNDGEGMTIEAGSASLADIIKNTDRGLLVGAVAAGTPGGNGEMSGVAKNCFYIEKGEIKGAVNETMISMNLAEIMNHVDSISSDVWNTGSYSLPYICFDEIAISSK